MKLSDALRELRIFNTYDLLSKFGEDNKDFAICFTPHSRQTMSSFGTYLYSPRGRLTNKFSYVKKIGVEEAKAFAKDKFNIDEWVTDPTDRGTLIPKYVLDAAKKYVASYGSQR